MLVLSRENNTPLSFWLGIPLAELSEWRKAHNRLAKEKKPK
jgi:hypothetical protein